MLTASSAPPAARRLCPGAPGGQCDSPPEKEASVSKGTRADVSVGFDVCIAREGEVQAECRMQYILAESWMEEAVPKVL